MGLCKRKPVFGVWEQQRRIPTCASAQSDQSLCFSRILDTLHCHLRTRTISCKIEHLYTLKIVKTTLKCYTMLHCIKICTVFLKHHTIFRGDNQTELPQTIQQNSVESDLGCTSRIYFNYADDNVTLTLYDVNLMS